MSEMDSCTVFGYKMGCWTSKKDSTKDNGNGNDDGADIPLTTQPNSNNPVAGSPQYSWSKRDRTDLSRFVIENVHGSVAIRREHEISGQGIVIQNCQRAIIVLLDYSATVLIDDCVDCTIFVSPVVGSVAMRNCSDCRIMSASEQFRTRDCQNMDCFIYCSSQPVIESSQRIRFAPFAADFNGLERLFRVTNLNVLDNKWHQVYDFCADEQYDEKHYTIISSDFEIEKLFQPLIVALKNEEVNFQLCPNVVPFTVGVTQIEMLKMRDGNFCDLFILFIGLCDLPADNLQVFQERLAKSHQLPHVHLIPLLTQCFERSSKHSDKFKKLFPGNIDLQKIVAILYRHNGHNMDIVDDHAKLLPEDIRDVKIEGIHIKTVQTSNKIDEEFLKYLSLFNYT